MGAAVALVAPRRADCKGDTSVLGWPLKAGFHGKHPQKAKKIMQIYGIYQKSGDSATKMWIWAPKMEVGGRSQDMESSGYKPQIN